MPTKTKISALTGYDGDTLDGSETLPIVVTDEGKTEGITVSQLFGNAPADSLAGDALPGVSVDADGHLTHQPSTDDAAAFAAQNAAGQTLLATDTTNGKVVIPEPGGGASDEVQIFENGGQAVINSVNDKVAFRGNGSRIMEVSTGTVIFETSIGVIRPNDDAGIELGGSANRFSDFYTQGDIKGFNGTIIGLTDNANAVNHLDVANAASGNAPMIAAKGGDSNIDLTLSPKGGNGFVVVEGANAPPRPSISGNPNLLIEDGQAQFSLIGKANSSSEIRFGDQGDNATAIVAHIHDTPKFKLGSAESGAFVQFQSGDGTEFMRGDSNQNLLVGKTSHSSDLLEAAGTVRAEGGTRSASPTISDDGVSSITPDRNRVKVHVYDGSGESGEATLDVSSGTVVNTNYTSTNLAFATGSHGGTTGTDGNITVAADGTNGTIDIENRTGSSKTITLSVIG